MAYTTQTQLSIIDTGNTPLDVVEPTLETKDRYTFGVELEMAIAGLHPAHADPSPNDPRSVRGVLGTVRKDDFGANDGFEVLQHIAQTLTAAGIPAEAQPHARFAPNWKPQNISAWIVTHDASIQAPQIYTAVDPSSAYYHYHQIELISPVFFYSHSALTAVKTLCKTMSSSFRINVNPSCGLHIHVGKKSSGIPFETTRNLLATLFTYESQIESIHPRSRQKNPLYCPNLRRDSTLRKLYPDRKFFLQPSLSHILKTTDIIDLHDAIAPAHDEFARGAYSIANLYRSTSLSAPTKRTIEFQQHEGSVDPDVVANWARFCVGVVEFADTVASEELGGLLGERIMEREVAIGQVLNELRMPDIAGFYAGIVKQREEERVRSLGGMGMRRVV